MTSTHPSAYEERSMTSIEQLEYQEAARQTDAIFAFEGFSPTELSKAISAAVMAGRVTDDQAVKEMCEYAMIHKTIDGFATTRNWL